MTCNVIATGSAGNAVILSDFLLLDCGVPYKALKLYVKDLRLVLMTHIHGDHFKPETIRRLADDRPLLRFGCCEWLAGALIQAGVSPANIDVFTLGDSYDYGPVVIEPVPLVHDVDNCGYKLKLGNERALYATDTFALDGIEAKDFDLYMIEANYTEIEMAERIKRKTEAGEFVYEYRAAAGHLSKEKADAWLAANATPGKSRVIYLHEHNSVHKERRK